MNRIAHNMMKKLKSAKYKLSFYNITLSYNNEDYLWNTYTDACIKLSRDGIKYLDDFTGENDDTEYFKILKTHGFIINSQIDEPGKIIVEEMTIMLNPYPERLGFTIAPGLGCNYQCLYCFEQEQLNNRVMDEETITKVVKYIIRRVENNQQVKQLHITWFGGEPLLYDNHIKKISHPLIDYCNNHNIVYSAGIITNGRFLDEGMAKELKKLHVTQAQISIDGTEKVYCRMKKATSFDYRSVISNISVASSYLKINVRINADEESVIEDIYKLIDVLLNDNHLDGKITIYPGFIRHYDDSKKKETESHGIHLAKELNIYQYLKNNYSVRNYGAPYPRRRPTSCLQACRANLCIGPLGEFYRCEHYFGDDKSVIGDIENGLYYNAIDNQFYELKHDSDCKNCKFFPLCLEGCIDDRVKDRRIICCDKYKDSFIQMQINKIASKKQ